MNIKHLLVSVVILTAGGNILKNAEQYNSEHPLVYTAEAAEVVPRMILIGTTTPEQTIEQKIRQTFPEDAETALKIAKCESSLKPSAINNRNKNGTTDGGIFQINSVHDKRLNELGLDKFNADDNIKFARLLWEEQGWHPWVCKKHI